MPNPAEIDAHVATALPVIAERLFELRDALDRLQRTAYSEEREIAIVSLRRAIRHLQHATVHIPTKQQGDPQ